MRVTNDTLSTVTFIQDFLNPRRCSWITPVRVQGYSVQTDY